MAEALRPPGCPENVKRPLLSRWVRLASWLAIEALFQNETNLLGQRPTVALGLSDQFIMQVCGQPEVVGDMLPLEFLSGHGQRIDHK